MVGFTESHVISSVDCEVSCIDVVSFESGLEQFWVVHCSVLFEKQLLVLSFNQ
jgi:hypothetical protein